MTPDVLHTLPAAQVAACLNKYNLKTCEGWTGAAHEMLAHFPEWVALVDAEQHGYVVAFEGDLYAMSSKKPEGYAYTPDDFLAADCSMWDDVEGCWGAMSPQACLAVLQKPVFRAIKHD